MKYTQLWDNGQLVGTYKKETFERIIKKNNLQVENNTIYSHTFGYYLQVVEFEIDTGFHLADVL